MMGWSPGEKSKKTIEQSVSLSSLPTGSHPEIDSHDHGGKKKPPKDSHHAAIFFADLIAKPPHCGRGGVGSIRLGQ